MKTAPELLRHKEAESEILRQDVAAFLARGGKIQVFAQGETSQSDKPTAKRVHLTVSKKRKEQM